MFHISTRSSEIYCTAVDACSLRINEFVCRLIVLTRRRKLSTLASSRIHFQVELIYKMERGCHQHVFRAKGKFVLGEWYERYISFDVIIIQ